FIFGLSLGKEQTGNEQQGFGVCHSCNVGGGTVLPSDQYFIKVRFPRDGCSYAFKEAPKAVYDRFPNAKGREKGLTIIRVSLTEEARVTVDGFGMPFANAEDSELEDWINGNKPIVENLTLLDVLGQRTFYFVISVPVTVAMNRFSPDKLPPPYVSPYGTDQEWDVDKFKGLIKVNKGHQFEAAYCHDDDNHHMTAVNQNNVQDVMWLDDEAIQIAATKFPAYFVRPDSGAPTADTKRFFVVVAMRDGFTKEHESAWRRLSKGESFLLHLYDNAENAEPDAKWQCKIIDHPATVPVLERHKTESHELVLLVRRPQQAAMNPDYIVKDRMELHRALVRGNGFYEWMTKKDAPKSIADDMSSLSVADTGVTYRPLPSVNFLDFNDDARAEAIVNEALPHDRERFRGYLSNRPLGLGIIAAKFRRVLCSAPTHVAVDNFAARLDKRTRAMAEACNRGKEQNDPSRYRHRVVIRAYKPNAEVGAFNALLKDPTLGDEAAPKAWGYSSRWTLHLSLAFWLLAILGSPAVRELHPDDDECLWDLRRKIDQVLPLKRLRDVATGVTTWEQYEQEGLVSDKSIQYYMFRLLQYAHMLCTTPAATENVSEYRDWKNQTARGVAVDEAANMNRADLYCVWGNTLSPCFLFGDPKQLPPTVMTTNEKDSAGNFLNRFAKSGSISALLFFQAIGIPVYR
ncbi:uncharacterized protein TRIVIDRAFT_1445, partial [Trichoderma virens Gv29-8]